MFKNLFRKKRNNQYLCEISIENENKWIYGMITYTDPKENRIKVFVFPEYIENHFKEKEKVSIKLLNDKNELLYNGLVEEKISTIFDQSLIIKLDGAQAFPNFRRNERFKFNCSAVIRNEKGLEISGLLDNISREGALLTAGTSFDSDGNILVEILASPERPIRFEASIVRRLKSRKGFSYAVKIESIDDENRKKLNELVTFLSMETDTGPNNLKTKKVL